MIVTSYTTGSVHYIFKTLAGSRSIYLVNVSKLSYTNKMIIVSGSGYGRHEVWKPGQVWPT